MEEILLQPQKKTTVWDNYVPLIKSGRHVDAYLTDQIDAPSEYNELCHALKDAYKGDTFTVHINSGGGYLDSAFAIIAAIKTTKATVTANIVGTVASAATIIALACDKIVIEDHVQFMIHNYSSSASGKGHEIKQQVDFMDKQLKQVFETVYAAFLTPHEMELVIAGKDMWLSKEEVTTRLGFKNTKDAKGLETYSKSIK